MAIKIWHPKITRFFYRMLCDFCQAEREETCLLNLPCGYLVCFEHVESISLASCCFMCQEHSLYQAPCLNMKKNRVKLDKIDYFKIKNLVTASCDKIDSLKNDHQTDIKSHFSNIINRIDLKRELLKNQFNSLVDNHYMEMFTEGINKLDANLSSQFGTVNCKEYSSCVENQNGISNDENQNQSNLKRSLTEENLNRKKFKSIKLPIYHSKFVEFNDEKLVFTSLIRPYNLVYLNTKNGEISQSSNPGSDSRIDFILSDNEIIVTIDCSNSVEIWEDCQFLRSFMCPKVTIILADLFEEKLFLVDSNYKLSVRKYSNGQIFKSFNLEEIKSLKGLSNDVLVTGHGDMIAKWNAQNGVKMDSIKLTSSVNVIERLNGNQIAAGTSDGKICLWNLSSSEFVTKQCHSGEVRFIQICPNSDILSYGSIDQTIKFWNLDLNIMHKIYLPGVKYGRFLSDDNVKIKNVFIYRTTSLKIEL
ncbi:WD40 repeat-containing [Brachionus plicatilis]|uniref:WD40 repeat-containing n=1 Tax=Brachionus plicatilis TaxID=10195 RepID=A0A3M7QX96_BRAPC|nr:WD40 repeat-containing [Brachionus plicatilis]